MTEYVTKDIIYVLLLKVFLKYPSRNRSRTCFFPVCSANFVVYYSELWVCS